MMTLKRMPCEYCAGKVVPRRVRDDYWHGKALVIVDGVPVGVCNRCGERYYAAEVLERLAAIAARPGRIRRRIRVPVTRFEALP